MWIDQRFHIFRMFQLEDKQTRLNERMFALFYIFYAEGSLVVDAKDSIFFFFNY